MKALAGLFIALLITYFSSVEASQQPLRVAAAADLRQVMPELIRVFEAHNPGLKVQAVYGPSGRFYGQIENGAPFHVFMSADLDYPRQLQAANPAHGPVKVYAQGTLALWHSKSTPPTLEDLYQARNIAIANPRHAPYGRAALNWLQQLNDGDSLSEKLVFAESASQVAHMVRSGGADIGVSALTVLRSSQLARLGSIKALPPELGYEPTTQGMMLTEQGFEHPHGQRFVDFVLADGQKYLRQYGFAESEEEPEETLNE